MNETVQEAYTMFTNSLLTKDESYDDAYDNYTAGMPVIHRCRREKACPGQEGNASYPVCQEGCHGPLCELCSKGYFPTSDGCSKCPPKWRSALQLVALIVVVLTFFIILSWKQAISSDSPRDTDTSIADSNETVASEKTDTWLDHCVAFLRIGIGFLQVMNGITAALAFVPWPSVMVAISTHLQVIQFNVIDMAATECLDWQFHFNHLWKTVIYFLFVAVSVVVIALLYGAWKRYVVCRRKINLQRRALAIKFCLTTVLWILYACYPSLSQYIIATVPYRDWSCIYINCTSPDQVTCQWYLKADVSVQCNHFSSALWRICQFLLLIPVCLPFLLLLLLYMKHRDAKNQRENRSPFVREVYASISFLHSDYESKFWYWEVVEMARKLLLTSGLQFFGRGSATQLAIASILANGFVLVHAQLRPIRKSLKWEHALHLFSLLVIALNIMLGVLKMITADSGLQSYLAQENAAYNPHTDEMVFGVLFYVANGTFFFILLGQKERGKSLL